MNDKKIDMLITAFNEFRSDFNDFRRDITDVVGRIDVSQQEDLKVILNEFSKVNKKLDDKDYEMQALNKRVFKLESEIEKITKQNKESFER